MFQRVFVILNRYDRGCVSYVHTYIVTLSSWIFFFLDDADPSNTILSEN